MKKTLGMFLFASLILAGTAFAETVSGSVAVVDVQAGTIVVSQADANGVAQPVSLTADAATVFTGVANLSEIQIGSAVKIEASTDESGLLKATSVEVSAPAIPAVAADAVPAVPAESAPAVS